MSESAIVVLVTAPDERIGAEVGRALVEEGLAACVNIVPGLRSIYRWQGQITEDLEVLLLIKSTTALLEPLVERVKALHFYELPEVLALPVAGGSAPYLAWLHAQLREPPR